MEIVETGAKGIFYLSYVTRQGDTQELDQVIAHALWALQNGVIRLGGNRNRGFGKIHVEEVHHSTFTCLPKDDSEEAKAQCARELDRWLAFLGKRKDTSAYDEHQTLEEYAPEGRSDYVKITVPLRQEGGISIRRYSTQPEMADFEQLTCAGEPVIPGTSWNGALRSAVIRMLKELGTKDYRPLIYEWFGCIDENEGSKTSQQSLIVFEESILKKGTFLPMTRVALDRFTAASKEGALYSEISYFRGDTTLCILVKKDENRDWKALVGAMDIVLEELKEGYVCVGGETAIGRGLFTGNGQESFDLPEKVTREGCRKALFEVLSK